MIEVRGLWKAYGDGSSSKDVLRGIDLTIAQGEFVAVMGPSGAGKTTLLSILGCLDVPSRGKYLLAGRDISALDDKSRSTVRNRSVGFVFQFFHLLPRLSVLDNVLLPLLYTDPYPPNSLDRGRHALEQVGLRDREVSRPSTLSGGEQQRVAIARALINDPPLLLADEPTGSLDDAATREILLFFRSIHEQGRSIVLVTHSHDVAAYADRRVVLADGRIASDDSRSS